jgi:bacterial/archaeal transporter family-2 protein
MPPALALVFWTVLGLLGGASLVVQASLIAGLRARLDSVVWAGLVSYLGGTAAMAAAILVARIAPPTLPRASAIPLQWWIGGFFGAAYLAAAIVLLPGSARRRWWPWWSPDSCSAPSSSIASASSGCPTIH